MNVNRGLLIISIIIISLIAVGAVSASDNVSDVVETADFKEIITVENNLEEKASLEGALDDVTTLEKNTENSEILSDNEPATPAEENESAQINSSKNYFDWTILYGKNGTDHNFITFNLPNILGKNNTGSFLVLDLDTFGKNTTDGSSYLILGLSGLLGNNTKDNSYVVFGLSSILGGNNTNDDSFLVVDLPGLGINMWNNGSLIIDLTNVLKQNGTSEGSFISWNYENETSTLDLSGAYKNGKLFDYYNVTDFFKEILSNSTLFLNNIPWDTIFNINGANLTSFFENIGWEDIVNGIFTYLDNYNWSDLFDGNLTSLLKSFNVTKIFGVNVSDIVWLLNFNFTSFLNDLNWTALFKGNFTALMDSLNITKLFNVNISDVVSLVGINFTELMDKLNIAKIFGVNVSDVVSLCDINLTSLIGGFNLNKLTSLFDGLNLTNLNSLICNLNKTSLFSILNWTGIFGVRNTTDTYNDSNNNNSQFSWLDNIFGNEEYGNGSIIGKIIDMIIRNDKNNSTNDVPATSDNTVTPQTKVNPVDVNKVVKKGSKISASKKTFKVNKKVKIYTITLKSGKKALKNAKVTIKIGKKIYTAKTNSKGKATFKITKLNKKGKYTAIIKFAGNNNYKSTNKKVTITVKK